MKKPYLSQPLHKYPPVHFARCIFDNQIHNGEHVSLFNSVCQFDYLFLQLGVICI
jgi:hypothetical protein